MTTARAKGELFLRSRSHSKWRKELTSVAHHPTDQPEGQGGERKTSAVQIDSGQCAPPESKSTLLLPNEQPSMVLPGPSASFSSQVNRACDNRHRTPILTEKSLRNLLRYFESSPSTSAKQQLGHVCQCLSRCLLRQGRMAEAETYQWRSLQYNLEVLGQDHPDTIASLSCLAIFQYRKRKYQYAKALASRVLECVSNIHGAEHSQTLAATHNLAIIDAAIIEEIHTRPALPEPVKISA